MSLSDRFFQDQIPHLPKVKKARKRRKKSKEKGQGGKNIYFQILYKIEKKVQAKANLIKNFDHIYILHFNYLLSRNIAEENLYKDEQTVKVKEN